LILASGFYFSKQGKLRTWLESFIMLFFGLLGMFLLFLWFLTDHDTTHANWNLLWANPIWLYLMIYPPRKCANGQRKISWIQMVLSTIALLGFGFLPQSFHPAVLPILGIQFYVLLKNVKPFWFTKQLNEKV